jgi:hypothetical protein
MDQVEQEIEGFLNTLDTFLKNVNNDVKITSPDDANCLVLKTSLALLCDSRDRIELIRKKIEALKTAHQKIEDLELRLGGWKKIIPACFGSADGKFAIHDFDRENAKKIKEIIREEHIDVEFVIEKFRAFLESNFPKNPNDDEMKLVVKFFSPQKKQV